MAVLVEAISVIVRRADLDAKYPGGWDAYVADCPNTTLCADNHLARVGFMVPADARLFVERLNDRGFVSEPRESREIAIVDHLNGPLQSASWAEVGSVTIDGHTVCACRLAGDSTNVLVRPDGWSWETSLYATGHFQPEARNDDRWQFLRHENGLDVLLDGETGKVVYAGRTGLTKVLDETKGQKRRDIN